MAPESSKHEYTVLLPLSEKRVDVDARAHESPRGSRDVLALNLSPDAAKGEHARTGYYHRDSSDNGDGDDSDSDDFEYSTSHRRSRSTPTRSRNDRLRTAAPVILVVLASLCAFTHLFHASTLSVSKSILGNIRGQHHSTGPPPAIVVGPRQNEPIRQRCSAPEFADAFRNVVLPAEAPSRRVNWTIPDLSESQEIPPFRFSWTVPKCDQPHIYTREEACDVLAAYRGIYFAGDSFIRHVWDALLLFLTNDIGGAISSKDPEVIESCRGDRLFNDRRPDWSIAMCRKAYYKNLKMLDVCPGREVQGLFSDQNKGFDTTDFNKWRSELPNAGRSLVRLDGAGVHYGYELDIINDTIIQPLLSLKQDMSPPPVLIWNAIHSPGDNILTHYYDSQGRPAVRKYNEAIKAIVDARQESYLDGGMQIIPWYNATEGAESFDGQHYSLQVNMEKVQILLNMLDLIWRDAADRGGLDGSEEGAAPQA